jgi:hypothetical protein
MGGGQAVLGSVSMCPREGFKPLRPILGCENKVKCRGVEYTETGGPPTGQAQNHYGQTSLSIIGLN